MKFIAASGLVMAATFIATPAYADPGKGALIVKGETCFIAYPVAEVPGVPDDYFIAFGETTDMQTVATPDGNGKLTCRLTSPPENRPEKTLQASGGFCFMPAGVVFNGARTTHTKSGQVTLSCQLNPSKDGFSFITAP